MNDVSAWVLANRKDSPPEFMINKEEPILQRPRIRKSKKQGITINEIATIPELRNFIIGLVLGFMIFGFHSNIIAEVLIILSAFVIFFLSYRKVYKTEKEVK